MLGKRPVSEFAGTDDICGYKFEFLEWIPYSFMSLPKQAWILAFTVSNTTFHEGRFFMHLRYMYIINYKLTHLHGALVQI